MKTSVKQLEGNWDFGCALDRHMFSSTYIGDNEFGHPQFESVRTEIGEALFQLKYRQDFNQIQPLAAELAQEITRSFGKIDLVIPMPPSKPRSPQPVATLAAALGAILSLPVDDLLLTKSAALRQLKDLKIKAEKLEALKGTFTVNYARLVDGPVNLLIVDDIFDTGASLDAACAALRLTRKIAKISVITLTRIR